MEEMHRQNLEVRTRILAAKHAHTLVSLRFLAMLLWPQGKYDEAEELNRQFLSVMRRVLAQGPQHIDGHGPL